MNIKLKKDQSTGELYIDFSELEHLFEDPSIVHSYTLEEREDGNIIIEFFDKDENKVFPKSV